MQDKINEELNKFRLKSREELKDPSSSIRKQMLRMQFPSPYSIAPNVKINKILE